MQSKHAAQAEARGKRKSQQSELEVRETGPTVDPELVNEIDEEVKNIRNDLNDLTGQMANMRRETGQSRSPSPARSTRSQEPSKELKRLEDKCNKYFEH